jgi:hypothetical protein
MGLTPKEHDRVVHWVKWFQWESNLLLHVSLIEILSFAPFPT